MMIYQEKVKTKIMNTKLNQQKIWGEHIRNQINIIKDEIDFP